MDIAEAARYGWDKSRAITLTLRNLTSDEFRNHAYLDDKFSESLPPSIYCMKRRNRITREDMANGDIAVQDGRDSYVSLSTSPIFKARKGYREFVLSMAKHLGAEEKDIYFSGDFIWDSISGNIWNGAKTVGHREIADLADFFQKEFVEKQKKGAETMIFASYDRLTANDVLRMEYDPRKVIQFVIE